jgi:hypothetical protein
LFDVALYSLVPTAGRFVDAGDTYRGFVPPGAVVWWEKGKFRGEFVDGYRRYGLGKS